MPRSESRTKTSIWDLSGDFVKLTKDAQRMYWQLYSQSTIMLNGILALTERRWSQTAVDETPLGVRDALVELEDHGYIALDWDTEEVLIKRFAHHDGVKPRSTVYLKAWQLLDHVASAALRAEAERQLARIGPDPRGPSSTDARQLSTDDYARGGSEDPFPVDSSVLGTEPQVNTPSDTPSDTQGHGVADTPADGTRTHARAVSVLRLHPPTTSESRLTDTQDERDASKDQDSGIREDEDRDEDQDRDRDTPAAAAENPPDQLVRLATRLAGACTAHPPVAQAEAAAVIAWAAPHVDRRLLDEAVAWAEQRPPTSRITLPRAAASVIRSKALDNGIPLPAYDPTTGLNGISGTIVGRVT